MWADLHTVQHADLKELASRLPTIILQARQDKTVRNYLKGYLRWKRWADMYSDVSHLPAKPVHIALYCFF